MDRRYQLENLKRHLAMLPTGTKVALSTDDWHSLLCEIQELRRQIDALQRGLASAVEAIEAER